MEAEFREAAQKNIEDVLQMMHEFNTIDNYLFEQDLRRDNLLKFILNKELGRLWLIYHESTIIGYVVLAFSFSFEFKGRDAFIDEFYLKEKFRKKGLGGKTLDFVLAQAMLLGVKAIHLEVEKHNKEANLLYHKKGFNDHNRFLMTRFMV